MTTPSNPEPGDQEPENQRPRDWRRRRRSERSSPESEANQQAESRSAETDEELSKPLIAVFEPALDLVALYSGPLILAGVIGLVTGIAVVTFISSMRLYGAIDIIIGAVLLLGVGSVLFSNVLTAFLSRTGRYGANTLILIGAFTGIIIVANVISFENKTRMDVTATNQFSLNSRTKDVLSNLTEDVRATAFYKDEEDSESPELAFRRNRVLESLEEFDSRTSKFTYRVVDPDLKPEVVSKYFGARPTSFVTETVVVEGIDSEKFDVMRPALNDPEYKKLEQDLLTSTLVASGSDKKVVYFLTGHGERDIVNTREEGYSELRSGLEGENYLVQNLGWDLTDVNLDVPANAAMVVIAGPAEGLPQAHGDALDRYLKGVMLVKNAPDELLTNDANLDPLSETLRREHGRVIFLAEPDTHDSFREFFAGWGLLISSGYIRDVANSVPTLPQTLRLRSFPNSDDPNNPALDIISPKGVPLRDVSMPGATAIDLIPHESILGILPLAETSVNSFLITDPDRTDPITNSGADSDRQGPFFPAFLIRSIGKVGAPLPTSELNPSEVSDIIIFGDSDFLSNSSYYNGNGRDLFLNSANFLAGDFSLVGIRSNDFTRRELNLDRNELKFVNWASWLFLPGILGMMAALVWWVRR